VCGFCWWLSDGSEVCLIFAYFYIGAVKMLEDVGYPALKDGIEILVIDIIIAS